MPYSLKTILSCWIISILFSVWPVLSPAYTLNIKGKQITLRVKDEPVLPILKEFGRSFHIAIVMPVGFSKTVRIDLKNVSVETAFEELLGRSNLFMVWHKDRLVRVGVLLEGKITPNSYLLTQGGENSVNDTGIQREIDLGDKNLDEQLNRLSLLSKTSLPPVNAPGSGEYIQGQIRMVEGLEARVVEIKEVQLSDIMKKIKSASKVINQSADDSKREVLLDSYIRKIKIKDFLEAEKRSQLAVLERSMILYREFLMSAQK